MRAAAVTAFAPAMLLVGCSVGELDLEGKQCPCAAGWTCIDGGCRRPGVEDGVEAGPGADAGPDDGGPCTIFPPGNPWNSDVSGWDVHESSDELIDSVGRDVGLHPDFGTYWKGGPIGYSWVEVRAGQPLVPVSFDDDDQSDPGPYPIPSDAPIVADNRRVLVVDTDACKLYELRDAHPIDGGESWHAGLGAIFDLRSNELRPDGKLSTVWSGLPIYPGPVRYAEVVDTGPILTQ